MDTYIYGQSLKIVINCVTPKLVKEKKWFNKEGGKNFNNFEKKEMLKQQNK